MSQHSRFSFSTVTPASPAPPPESQAVRNSHDGMVARLRVMLSVLSGMKPFFPCTSAKLPDNPNPIKPPGTWKTPPIQNEPILLKALPLGPSPWRGCRATSYGRCFFCLPVWNYDWILYFKSISSCNGNTLWSRRFRIVSPLLNLRNLTPERRAQARAPRKFVFLSKLLLRPLSPVLWEWRRYCPVSLPIFTREVLMRSSKSWALVPCCRFTSPKRSTSACGGCDATKSKNGRPSLFRWPTWPIKLPRIGLATLPYKCRFAARSWAAIMATRRLSPLQFFAQPWNPHQHYTQSHFPTTGRPS